MKRITDLTKRDIFKVLQYGFVDDIGIIEEFVKYPYFGCLDELDFLSRIYDLESMPSYDSRFKDARGDIIQHTINNDDYEMCWVFSDDRFNLTKGEDEVFLRFLSEIFHPEVRDENLRWKDILSKINSFLICDGYELYSSSKISGREIFNWRIYDKNNYKFIPFSDRNQEIIKSKTLKLHLSKVLREKILRILVSYNSEISKCDDSGWNYQSSIEKEFFVDICKYYTPKCFSNSSSYINTNSISDFVLNNYPYYVFDIIEYFSYMLDNSTYIEDLNKIFSDNEIGFGLFNNRLIKTEEHMITDEKIGLLSEVGLKELINNANKLYDRKDYGLATEKIWDAFERVKSYKKPGSKKESIEILLNQMSNNDQNYYNFFESEFSKLTKIGNDYRIRHHEIDKIDIPDERYFRYLFKKCSILILCALEYLE